MGRPLEDGELKFLVTDMLNAPTDRDKQTRIGASGIGNPCDYCLAHALLATGQKRQDFWMGARVGTAIHAALEAEAQKHVDRPRRPEFNSLEGALTEHRVVVGHVPGYGTIKSTLDLYLTQHEHLVDYKSSTRAKIKKMKATGSVPIQYIYQQHLYAWALEQEGKPVQTCSLVFIARDGTGDSDVWVYSFPYEEAKAQAAWGRMVSIYEWLHEKEDPYAAADMLASDPECWYCDNVLGRT